MSCRKNSPRATSSAMRRARPVWGTRRPLGPRQRYQPKRPVESAAMLRKRSPFSMNSVTSTVWPSWRQAPTNLRPALRRQCLPGMPPLDPGTVWPCCKADLRPAMKTPLSSSNHIPVLSDTLANMRPQTLPWQPNPFRGFPRSPAHLLLLPARAHKTAPAPTPAFTADVTEQRIFIACLECESLGPDTRACAGETLTPDRG